MNVFCDPEAAAAIFRDGEPGQGIWWPDNQGAVVALLADGMTTFPPPKLPLLRSRRPRSTTPGARRA